jgi:hypothetical protein
MDSLLWKGALALVALYAVAVLATYYLQRKLLYFPDTRRIPPASLGLSGVSELEIETPDGARVIAWHGAAKPGQPTLLYFHGNGGSLVNRSERIAKYLLRGRGILMMTYRGYGGSTGAPSEARNVADAKLAYARLRSMGVAAEDIVVYGESLGSGVAVQVAAEFDVGGIVLDAPYTSIVDMAERVYPFLPSRWLMSDRYETMRYIGRLRAPLLVVHGEADQLIPVEMGRRVAAAAPGPAEIVTLPGAGHSDHHLYGSYEAINAWIDRLRGTGAGQPRRRAEGG